MVCLWNAHTRVEHIVMNKCQHKNKSTVHLVSLQQQYGSSRQVYSSTEVAGTCPKSYRHTYQYTAVKKHPVPAAESRHTRTRIIHQYNSYMLFACCLSTYLFVWASALSSRRRSSSSNSRPPHFLHLSKLARAQPPHVLFPCWLLPYRCTHFQYAFFVGFPSALL